MTTFVKWCTTLVVCTIIAISAQAQTAMITSSQEIKAAHKMDEAWLEVSTNTGLTASIQPVAILSDPNLRSKTDILIISSGISTLTTNQFSNILQFLVTGGNIYIQSEYLSDFDVNLLFKYLVDETGSGFQWLGHANNDLGPVNIINGLEGGLSESELDYFWYGAYGCGEADVLPIFEIDDNNFGFYYRSNNDDLGNLITQTDHDWIRTIDNNPTPRKALMARILNVLENGLEEFPTIETPTISIDNEVNFCMDEYITAEVSDADSDDIQWYINSTPTTIGASISISSLSQGDTIYAAIGYDSGCSTKEIESESIIYTSETHTPNINTTLSGNATACPGTTITIQADYDQSLPQVRHHWFLNGQDTPTHTDYYASDDLQDGDILEHGLSYFDGCQMVDMPTEERITIEITTQSNPTISIGGTSQFCNAGNTAELTLEGMDVVDAEINWYVNDRHHSVGNESVIIDATEDDKEIKVIVKYNNDCAGWITLSAVKTIKTSPVTLETLELGNIDCENPEGFIEVFSNGSEITYTWSNGADGNYLNNLTEGTYSVTATSAEGCSDSKSFEITKTTFPLLDSLNITQPMCNEGHGTVDLFLSDNNLNNINIQWINANNEIVSTDHHSSNLPEGKYTIRLDVHGNCLETYEVEIIGFHDNQNILVDTIEAIQLDEVKLQANIAGYENYRIEWAENDALSCTNCNRPTFTAINRTSFDYYLVSPEGCKIKRRILVIVDVTDPYFAPSGFTPNNDGINDNYIIHTRTDVFPTSNLMIFDRWGSLIFQDDNNEGWNGKVLGKPVQKGIFVFAQEFEDTLGNTYMAKGSITVIRK